MALELGQNRVLRELLRASRCRSSEARGNGGLIERGPQLSRQCFNVAGLVQQAVSPASEYLFGPPFAPGCDYWNPTRHGFHEHHGKRLAEERGKDKGPCAPEVRPGVRDETGHEHVVLDSLLPGSFNEVPTFWPLTKNDKLQ